MTNQNTTPTTSGEHVHHSVLVGVLSTTAVMLLVALAVVQSRPSPALAEGMTIMKDDFMLTVGAATRNDEELVYLVDSSNLKMNVYRFDPAQKQISLVQTISLKDMRDQAAAGAKPPPKKK